MRVWDRCASDDVAWLVLLNQTHDFLQDILDGWRAREMPEEFDMVYLCKRLRREYLSGYGLGRMCGKDDKGENGAEGDADQVWGRSRARHGLPLMKTANKLATVRGDDQREGVGI